MACTSQNRSAYSARYEYSYFVAPDWDSIHCKE